MGYSIFINLHTKEEMNSAHNYLVNNYIPLCEESGLRIAKGHDERTGLSYPGDTTPYPVGFDYASWISTPERVYAWRIIAKMAIENGLKGYYYDGDEFVVAEEPTLKDIKKAMKFSISTRSDSERDIIAKKIWRNLQKMFPLGDAMQLL